MTVKEYLQQAYKLTREIQLETENVAKMRASLYGRTQRYKNTGGKGNNYGSFDETVQRVIDYEREINAKIDTLVTKRLEIEAVINDADNAVDHEILKRRYLLYQQWDEIAESLGYGVRHVHKLHKAVLKKMALNGTYNL